MDRREFIANVSASLGRRRPPSAVQFDARYGVLAEAEIEAERAKADATRRSDEPLESAVESLTIGGWKVHRASTVEDVGGIVRAICRESDIKNAVRTEHLILEHAQVDAVLSDDEIECSVTRLADHESVEDRRHEIESAKQHMFEVDAGITGGDYIIAETGTLAIHPRRGVARLASLAPPIHIAVVRRSQILPSLDELFLLEHVDLGNGKRSSGMNLISGPSRTGDIEATIVHGIHGPTETHIVLVG